MKILAAVMYVHKIRFFKNALHLPIEERRVKKRTPMRFLVYDPTLYWHDSVANTIKVTACHYEKKEE